MLPVPVVQFQQENLMSSFTPPVVSLVRGLARTALLASLVVAIGAHSAVGQSATQLKSSPPLSSGEVSLDLPNAPPATVEIDLSRGLIRHALSLGDAAIAGFLDGLKTEASSQTADSAKFIAGQLTSARELSDIASEAIHEVHVRVWDSLPNEGQVVERALEHFDTELEGTNWEQVLSVRDKNDSVRVFVQRDSQAESIRGVFVIVGDGNDLVLANATGDLSPDKVQRFVSSATKVAMKLGLDKELNKVVGELKREMAGRR